MNRSPKNVKANQSEAQNELLVEGYDTEQVDMMAERVILVDTEDRVLGSMSKVDAHRGDGVLHRAFSIHIFDDQNRLLMQKRASHKITFPDVWANTVCSHPLHVPEELNDVEGNIGTKLASMR